MVGCPVFQRDWILPYWFDRVETAFAEVNIEPEYAFVLTLGDDLTAKCVSENSAGRNLVTTLVDQERDWDKRDWCAVRYHEMARLRNALLRMVRTEKPALFLSLDSDILVQHGLMSNLLESIDKFDAVGGLTHMISMTTATCPSWGTFGQAGELIRKDSEGVHRVDIIMALKLMTPKAYNVDYKFHELGEDLGWCRNCQEQGVVLGFDGRLTNKHVMSRAELDIVDPRCGY